MSIALRPRYRRNQYAIPRPASARPLLLAVSETETRAVDRIINALFVEGTRPTIPSILRRIRKAPWQSLTVEKVRAALLVLHHQGVLELDADWYDLYVRWDRHWDDFGDAEPWDGDTGEDLEGEAVIVLCYPPFSGNNMGISVTGLTKHYWAPGALYAFALPFAVAYEAPVIVSTRCPGCHTAITLDIEISRPPSATACDFRELPIAHFLFPMWSGLAVAEWSYWQRLFCKEKCVDAWCQSVGQRRGGVMDVDALWHLAKGWCPKNERNAQMERQQLLEKLGLKGPFWALREKPQGWERYRMLR